MGLKSCGKRPSTLAFFCTPLANMLCNWLVRGHHNCGPCQCTWHHQLAHFNTGPLLAF